MSANSDIYRGTGLGPGAEAILAKFEEGVAEHNGQVRYGIAAVLDYIGTNRCDPFDVYSVRCSEINSLVRELRNPSLLERALAGDGEAARKFLQSAGILGEDGQLMPQYRTLEES